MTLELKPGAVNFVIAHHDDACPTSATGEPAECVCTPRLEVVDETHFNAVVVRDRRARREAERDAQKAMRKAAKR